MAWQTPKTDWTAADGVTDEDFNRIEGNIAQLKADTEAGKQQINDAIVLMGQTPTSNAYADLAAAIRNISSDATASIADVLTGKTFYQGGSKKTGTMPDRGTVNVTLTSQGQQYTIPSGKHSGNGTVTANITNLTAGNIKAGATVGGITGSFTSDATAAASNILSGKTAYVNGSKVTGTMPNYTGTYNADATNVNGNYLELSVPNAGYYSDNAKIRVYDANWISENIREGVNIFGKTGTMSEGINFKNTLINALNYDYDPSILELSVSGSGYIIEIYNTDSSSSEDLKLILDGKVFGQNVTSFRLGADGYNIRPFIRFETGFSLYSKKGRTEVIYVLD